jgi:hypothetical protein
MMENARRILRYQDMQFDISSRQRLVVSHPKEDHLLQIFNPISLIQIDAALIARQADAVEKTKTGKLDMFSKT